MSTTASALYATSLPFTSAGKLVSVANPNRDGTGTLVPIALPFTNGSGARVSWVRITALAATTAGMIRFFVGSQISGYFLLAEIPVSAVTPNGTTPAFTADWFPPFNFANQQAELAFGPPVGLYASTEQGEPFAVAAFGGTL